MFPCKKNKSFVSNGFCCVVQGGGEIDDVLACQADPNGMVFVKDTFNYADRRGNLIDDPHLDSHNVSISDFLLAKKLINSSSIYVK